MLAVVQAPALFLAVAAATTMDQQALYERVTVLNKQALDEIERQAFLAARKHLLEAAVLARKRGERDVLLARTFVHLGGLTIIEGPKAKAPYGLLASCRSDETLSCPWREDKGDPDLPRRIKALDCYNRDMVQEAKPLILRCATNDHLKIERVTLYYRKGGGTKFRAWDMSRNARGWWTATLPADQVGGKSAAYYMVAKDVADRVVASHGDPDNPDAVLIARADECRCEGPPDEPVNDAINSRP